MNLIFAEINGFLSTCLEQIVNLTSAGFSSQLPAVLLGGVVGVAITQFFTWSRETSKRVADLRTPLYAQVVECLSDFDDAILGGSWNDTDLRAKWKALSYRMDLLASKETQKAHETVRSNVFSIVDNEGLSKLGAHIWVKDRDTLIRCMRKDMGVR